MNSAARIIMVSNLEKADPEASFGYMSEKELKWHYHRLQEVIHDEIPYRLREYMDFEEALAAEQLTTLAYGELFTFGSTRLTYIQYIRLIQYVKSYPMTYPLLDRRILQ